MMTNTEKNEKICWHCKRTLVGENKIGLCPRCVNNIGSVAALAITGAVAGGIGLIYKMVQENGGEFVKGVIDVIKPNKS